MNAKITKKDVVFYFADLLDRSRRREIEMACRSDPQVQRWFEELTPTDEEMDEELMPEVVVDTPKNRKIAALAYLSVEQDEQVEEWTEWLHNSAKAGHVPAATPADIESAELLEGADGQFLYRQAVPMQMAADHETPKAGPKDIPCIIPDYTSGRLTIRQLPDQVTSGTVAVVAVRRRGAENVEVFQPVQVELEFTERPNGEQYWYADIPLESLIGNFQPGDDFIYCVEAAAEE